ncbi:hypothetical protein FA15DRAFT_300903 [Coprinopsis marcescibilis]|uniref:Secreted protein n=1 Tax=Coprinopsis marcescibilis TaxID=230819 RepID=A0A5C3KCM6_COPMA|nr:hypothetical protein FA15DRAFT_300903 [Coprinopsis marcescibilis]
MMMMICCGLGRALCYAHWRVLLGQLRSDGQPGIMISERHSERSLPTLSREPIRRPSLVAVESGIMIFACPCPGDLPFLLLDNAYVVMCVADIVRWREREVHVLARRTGLILSGTEWENSNATGWHEAPSPLSSFDDDDDDIQIGLGEEPFGHR